MFTGGSWGLHDDAKATRQTHHFQPAFLCQHARLENHRLTLGAGRAWGVEARIGPSEDSFSRILRLIAEAMGQEAGEKWTAAVNLQPTLPKPDRRPGACNLRGQRRLRAGGPSHAAASPRRFKMEHCGRLGVDFDRQPLRRCCVCASAAARAATLTHCVRTYNQHLPSGP